MRTRVQAVLVALMVLVGLLGGSGIASAHGGDISISVSPPSVSGNTVTYTVTLTWEDGHPVEGEPVSVTAKGPGGTRSANFGPTNSAGRASGSITLSPGTWSVTFRADGFTHTISQTIATPTTTTPPPTTAPPTTKPPATTAPPATRPPTATSPPATSPPAAGGPLGTPPTAAGAAPRPGTPPSGQSVGRATTSTSRPRTTTSTAPAAAPTVEARVEAAVEELVTGSTVTSEPTTTTTAATTTTEPDEPTVEIAAGDDRSEEGGGRGALVAVSLTGTAVAVAAVSLLMKRRRPRSV